ncbi:7tm 6 domain containing protein [Asbolus verrucosus]|uniref:Odorant receptor n=1 Tax=Asbolus verrucosus TaxID=1661398 RepID=A0A482W8G8_ASBVE|nr:7tm 6 domain containing protein [Asbolus verrucosus]
MKKFNWTLNIKTNIVILKLVGLWPIHDGTCKSNLYTLYKMVLALPILIVNAVFQTMNIIFFIEDIQIFTSSLFMVITLYLVMIKYYYFDKNLEIFKQIETFLNEELMFQPKTPQQRIMSENGLKLWRKLYILFWILVVFTVFFWTSFPIIDSHEGERRLLFWSWYPYDVGISPFYEITYLFQTACIWFMALVSVSCDTTTTALMTYIGLQCDLLCDNLRNLGYSVEDNLNNDIDRQFTMCIKHHKKILNMVLFGQFSTSAVCIGLTMFQLTIITPFTNEFYCLLFFGTSITTQMFQFCWFANEVQFKVHSSNIAYAAFETNFVYSSMAVKRNLVIFMARTQKPIEISVLNLFILSLATFIKIIQTAWSYLTMLRQVS